MQHVRSLARIAVGGPSGRDAPATTWAGVGKGTVFIRPSAFGDLPESMRLETAWDTPWRVAIDVAAAAIEQELAKSGWLLSSAVLIEASAFGCDSKVLDRAIRRVLEHVEGKNFDSVEIMEIRRHEDSGLDYVSILARARRIRKERPSDTIGYGMSSPAAVA